MNKFRKKNTKFIFDCSHSQGLRYKEKFVSEYADISFFSLQGHKAITGGEGGVILTNNYNNYEKMINLHHPGHIENKFSLEYAGVSTNIKLRMHPLASLIADESLDNFYKKNKKLIKKYLEIYKFLNNIKNLETPSYTNNISGFHYGLPFFLNSNEKDYKWPIIRYNWPIYDNNNLQIEDKKKKLFI